MRQIFKQRPWDLRFYLQFKQAETKRLEDVSPYFYCVVQSNFGEQQPVFVFFLLGLCSYKNIAKSLHLGYYVSIGCADKATMYVLVKDDGFCCSLGRDPMSKCDFSRCFFVDYCHVCRWPPLSSNCMNRFPTWSVKQQNTYKKNRMTSN